MTHEDLLKAREIVASLFFLTACSGDAITITDGGVVFSEIIDGKLRETRLDETPGLSAWLDALVQRRFGDLGVSGVRGAVLFYRMLRAMDTGSEVAELSDDLTEVTWTAKRLAEPDAPESSETHSEPEAVESVGAGILSRLEAIGGPETKN